MQIRMLVSILWFLVLNMDLLLLSRLPGLHFIMEEICLLGYGKILPAHVMLLPIPARMGKEHCAEKKSQ